MAKTLVIIDMQPSGFKTAKNEEVVKNIIEEIRLCKKRGGGIVLCEYKGYGKTDSRIIQAIGDYSRKAQVFKNDDDGGNQVVACARNNNFDLMSWRVVGVNIAHCVNATVQGMRKILPAANVDIKMKACNCLWENLSESWFFFRTCNGTAVRTI